MAQEGKKSAKVLDDTELGPEKDPGCTEKEGVKERKWERKQP
jgi:hypothetical protein